MFNLILHTLTHEYFNVSILMVNIVHSGIKENFDAVAVIETIPHYCSCREFDCPQHFVVMSFPRPSFPH